MRNIIIAAILALVLALTSVAADKALAHDPNEPNDSCDQATEFELGRWFHGAFSDEHDLDWFVSRGNPYTTYWGFFEDEIRGDDAGATATFYDNCFGAGTSIDLNGNENGPGDPPDFSFETGRSGTILFSLQADSTFEYSVLIVEAPTNDPPPGPAPTSPPSVEIDIKPGSDTNPVNLRSRGVLPVAILSQEDFDATTEVNADSLTFGHLGLENSLHRRGRNDEPNCGATDVNGDGNPDFVCHFHTQRTGFQPDDTQGALRGKTTGGLPFQDSDLITVVRH